MYVCNVCNVCNVYVMYVMYGMVWYRSVAYGMDGCMYACMY